MAKIKAAFLLPVQGNTGEDLTGLIEETERALFVAFGGHSSFTGYIKGTWKMQDGTRQADTSYFYWIVMEEAELPELEKILLNFKHLASQEAMYLEVEHHVDVRFL